MGRINSLESLRGLMALWVVVGHTIRNTGFTKGELGVFNLLVQPGLAVDVFIILSGFVIFVLLDKGHAPYGPFILKRWFRLAPVYLAALTVSLVFLDAQLDLVSHFPFKTASIANNVAIMTNARQYLPQQLIAHLLMLHGLIADSILPSSQYAFLGAAWSISVEWQFYLVAPLLARAIMLEKWRQLTAYVLLICVLLSLNYGGEGFAVKQAGYFIIGIVSYYAWKNIEKFTLDARKIEFLAVLLICTAYFFLTRWISILIWLVVFSAIAARKLPQATKTQQTVLNVLELPAFQWLGKISYSMYMVHMLVFYGLTHLLLAAFPTIEKTTLLAWLLPSVTIVTLAVSAFTYRYIELPGIKLGQKLSLAWMGDASRQPKAQATTL